MTFLHPLTGNLATSIGCFMKFLACSPAEQNNATRQLVVHTVDDFEPPPRSGAEFMFHIFTRRKHRIIALDYLLLLPKAAAGAAFSLSVLAG